MKKTIILALCLAFTSALFSQKKIKFKDIIIDTMEVENGDSVIEKPMFKLMNVDHSKLIYRMIDSLGTPESKNASWIRWKHLDIDGVGNDIGIGLWDGILTKDFTPISYKDYEEKDEKLGRMKESDHRFITLTFYSADGTHMYLNDKEQKAAIGYIQQLIKGL